MLRGADVQDEALEERVCDEPSEREADGVLRREAGEEERARGELRTRRGRRVARGREHDGATDVARFPCAAEKLWGGGARRAKRGEGARGGAEASRLPGRTLRRRPWRRKL